MIKTYKINIMIRYSIIILVAFLSVSTLKAQDDKIKFSAISRAMQLNNKLDKADTIHIDNTSSGNVLLDLGININPDKKTEIQAIIRFNNNIGGFYGSDAKASLRQLCVKGIIGNFLNYQVGDIYLKLTPYTFFNNNAEGTINEATIFKDIRRDYTNYENFSNKGNSWWQQGVHSNMSLAINGFYFDTLRFDIFFLRNRSTDFAKIPSSFHTGGKTTFSRSNKLKFAVNYLDLYDIDYSDKNKNLKRNPVTSAELNLKIFENDNLKMTLNGESGFSNLIDSISNTKGYFYDAGLSINLKHTNLQIGTNFNFVDPNFYSSAAQSKRVNFSKTPGMFPLLGNDPNITIERNTTISDLVNDISIYNSTIVRTLMPFNFIMGNAQPYGKSTPNRTGIELFGRYKDSAQIIDIESSISFLSNIIGEGTTELRHFTILKTSLNFNIGNFINSKKQLLFTSGIIYESTQRGGSAIEKIKLNNNLIDLGISIETIKKLDFLIGYKTLLSSGNEYLSIRNTSNEIINFIKYDHIDITESILAIGFKYRFSSATYLMIQNSTTTAKNNNNSAIDLKYNQLMILFNMNF